MDESDREAPLRDYLLGGLTPTQREEIEERLLSDPDFHDELQATGDDLIHAYLAGGLPADDHARFESHFLASPRRRERVAFVRSLVAAVDRVAHEPFRTTAPHAVQAPRRRSLSVLLPWAAALAVGLGGGGWSLSERRLREREAAAAAGREAALRESEASLRNEKAALEASLGELKARVEARAGPGDVPIWPLRSGIERGTAPAESFTAPPGSVVIRLRVPLDHALRVPAYRASLQNAGGQEILSVRPLRAASGNGGRTLDVPVPGDLLRAGAYVLSVQRDTPDGEELTATTFVVR